MHAGFRRSLFTSTLYLQVRAALRVDLLRYGSKPLYLVGHSLGAAMASLAAPRLKHELNPPAIHLYTFGCPRTGNIVRPNICTCFCRFHTPFIASCTHCMGFYEGIVPLCCIFVVHCAMCCAAEAVCALVSTPFSL